jgi:hypothetical protein
MERWDQQGRSIILRRRRHWYAFQCCIRDWSQRCLYAVFERVMDGEIAYDEEAHEVLKCSILDQQLFIVRNASRHLLRDEAYFARHQCCLGVGFAT